METTCTVGCGEGQLESNLNVSEHREIPKAREEMRGMEVRAAKMLMIQWGITLLVQPKHTLQAVDPDRINGQSVRFQIETVNDRTFERLVVC
jgi:hypothetical protein